MENIELLLYELCWFFSQWIELLFLNCSKATTPVTLCAGILGPTTIINIKSCGEHFLSIIFKEILYHCGKFKVRIYGYAFMKILIYFRNHLFYIEFILNLYYMMDYII